MLGLDFLISKVAMCALFETWMCFGNWMFFDRCRMERFGIWICQLMSKSISTCSTQLDIECCWCHGRVLIRNADNEGIAIDCVLVLWSKSVWFLDVWSKSVSLWIDWLEVERSLAFINWLGGRTRIILWKFIWNHDLVLDVEVT